VPESVAGWFPDPSGRFEARFWDGGQWTGAVMTHGEVKSDSDTDPAASPPLSVNAATGGGGGAVVPPSPTPGRNERTTTLPPAEAQVRLVQALSMHGARIEMSGQGQIRATVDIKGKVSIPLLGILLFSSSSRRSSIGYTRSGRSHTQSLSLSRRARRVAGLLLQEIDPCRRLLRRF